jgi:hypothetical protein
LNFTIPATYLVPEVVVVRVTVYISLTSQYPYLVPEVVVVPVTVYISLISQYPYLVPEVVVVPVTVYISLTSQYPLRWWSHCITVAGTCHVAVMNHCLHITAKELPVSDCLGTDIVSIIAVTFILINNEGVLFSTQVFFSWVLFLYKGQAFHSFWTA